MPAYSASPSSSFPAPPPRNASPNDRRSETAQSRLVVQSYQRAIVDAYVLEPGTAGNNVSTPHAALMNGVTDLTVIVCAALDDWTPGSDQTLVSKYTSAAAGSWFVAVTPAGILKVQVAIAAAVGATSSSLAPSVADGNAIWLNIQRTSTGSTDYYYSNDPPGTPLSAVTWTALQLNRAGTAGAPDDSTVSVHVGGQNVGATNPLAGKVFRATAFKGLGTGGTQLFDMRPADWTSGSTWVSSTTGETWTINGTASVVPAVGGASSDVSVVASCSIAVGSSGLGAPGVTGVATEAVGIGVIGLDAHNVDAVASESAAVGALALDAHNVIAIAAESVDVGGVGVATHELASLASEANAASPVGVITHSVTGAATETIAVAGTAAPSHDVTTLATEAVAAGSAAAFTQSVTAAGSTNMAAASTAAITHSVTAQAAEGVATGLIGLDAHNVTAVSTEAIAAGGSGTTLTGSDISVFARAELAIGAVAAITHSVTAQAAEAAGMSAQAAATRTLPAAAVQSVAAGESATITRSGVYTARLDAATSIAAGIALAGSLVATVRAAAAAKAAATYTTTSNGPTITGRLTTSRGDVDRQTVRGDTDRATSTPITARATTALTTDRVLEPA